MRLSQYPINTMKETPAEAEVISHQLMLRAGLIRRLAAGLYSWLPMGMRALHKVERIVREEMDRAGALELVMPVVQPGELWQESGRWSEYGPELLRFKDRHERDFVLGPTHEDVITDIVRRELQSYRQLPVNFYQIQTKFRDEVRPRFGVMRAREFIMKDAYSFHVDEASLQAGYRAMYEAYTRIFTRTGLTFRSVRADSGAIGGDVSQEFHVLAETGEDVIAFSDGDDYAANLEVAVALPPQSPRPPPREPLRRVSTPGARTIADVAQLLRVDPSHCVKTLVVDGTEGKVVALVVRGDHELNAVKAQKLEGVASPLRLASAERVLAATGSEPGYVGPVALECRVYADHSALTLADFVCGANEKDMHLTGVNWDRDVQGAVAADLRNAVDGDPSPSGRGRRRAHAGDAVLAGAARPAPLPAGARRTQHSHGLRHPALLSRLRAQRRAQGAGALQRQHRAARLSGSRDQPVDALARRRRSRFPTTRHAPLSGRGVQCTAACFCAAGCGASVRATPSRRESAAPV